MGIHSGNLFSQFPDLEEVYYYALRLGKIFTDYTDKNVARAKLALWCNEIEEYGYDTFTTVANSVENHYWPNYMHKRGISKS